MVPAAIPDGAGDLPVEAPGGHHDEGGSPLLDVSVHGWIKPTSPRYTSLEGPHLLARGLWGRPENQRDKRVVPALTQMDSHNLKICRLNVMLLIGRRAHPVMSSSVSTGAATQQKLPQNASLSPLLTIHRRR